MTEKEYIEKLEELAFQFRDDNDICDNTCDKCPLSKKLNKYGLIKKEDGVMSYCDMLVAIYNDSEDNYE